MGRIPAQGKMERLSGQLRSGVWSWWVLVDGKSPRQAEFHRGFLGLTQTILVLT
jgi:hypothetical protein